MTDEFNGDYLVARQKLEQGRKWRGEVNVPLGDTTVTLKHRLLNEEELADLKLAMPDTDPDEDEFDDPELQEKQERLLELQSKNELSDEEEEELEELHRYVSARMDNVEDDLGEEAMELLMEYGADVLRPSEEDVQDLLDAPLEVQRKVMGDVPQTLTKRKAREHLIEDMKEQVKNQPYPVKMQVGIQAMQETISVVGNSQ